MSEEKNIRQLLLKFIQHECSQEEIDQIITYIQKVKGTEGLPSFEEVVSLLDEFPETDSKKADRLYGNIIRRAKSQPVRPNKTKIWRYASVAAVFVGLIALGYLYQQGAFDTIQKDVLIPTNEVITLELEDGTIEEIDPTATKQVRDSKGNLVGNQEKTQLVYSKSSDTEKLVYNTLTVPYGKQFDVVLSDGTTIYMNAGTELKYPVSFLSTGNRTVFISGEAYFNVASDKERPFIVNAEELNVEVLGTEFNVLAYPEDGLSDVVLVEGSVGMYADSTAKESATVLKPGLRGSFDKTVSEITTEEVNVKVYTSWRNGELVYRNLPFKHMLKKLERHYNIDIVLNNEELGEEPFSASFDNKSIGEVLSFFDEIYGIDYEIKNNTVYIN